MAARTMSLFCAVCIHQTRSVAKDLLECRIKIAGERGGLGGWHDGQVQRDRWTDALPRANNESSEVVDILLPVTFYFIPSTRLDNVKNF